MGSQPYDTNPQPEGPGHLIWGFPSPISVACATALESDLPLGFCQRFAPLAFEVPRSRKAAVPSKL